MHAATKAKVIGSALRGTDRHMCWPAHPVIEQYIVDDVHFMLVHISRPCTTLVCVSYFVRKGQRPCTIVLAVHRNGVSVRSRLPWDGI